LDIDRMLPVNHPDVCAVTGYRESTNRRLIKEGRLTAVVVRGRLRIPESALADFAEAVRRGELA